MEAHRAGTAFPSKANGAGVEGGFGPENRKKMRPARAESSNHDRVASAPKEDTRPATQM